MLPPIDVVDLIPEERAALLELLAELAPEDWARPTACPGWTVKDIALHLLGDDIGMLSRWRDGFTSPHFADGFDISTWEGLLGAIDRQNAQWVAALRRTSPHVLIQLLTFTGAEMASLVRAIDPNEPGGPVDWAGPEPAPAWMHVVREYTEYWIHQQHIRDALGRPGLTTRRLYFPVLDAFARAIPHTLRTTAAAEGAAVRLTITGEAGGTWTARRGGETWELTSEAATAPVSAEVTLDQDLAWRLFTKGIDPAAARDRIRITGDVRLAAPLIEMVAILA